MKRFVWRLQRILDVKTIEEQTKKTELFKLTEKLVQAQGQLLMQKRILEDLIADISVKSPQNRLSEQELLLKFSVTIDEQIKQLNNKVSKLESQQRKKIAEVLKAKRFKEGLERLRVEAKMQFIKEQEKLEQKELDEVATIAFARSKLSHREQT